MAGPGAAASDVRVMAGGPHACCGAPKGSQAPTRCFSMKRMTSWRGTSHEVFAGQLRDLGGARSNSGVLAVTALAARRRPRTCLHPPRPGPLGARGGLARAGRAPMLVTSRGRDVPGGTARGSGHAEAFIERIESLAAECPAAHQRIAGAYIGGVAATAALERFWSLQDELRVDEQGWSQPPERD